MFHVYLTGMPSLPLGGMSYKCQIILVIGSASNNVLSASSTSYCVKSVEVFSCNCGLSGFIFSSVNFCFMNFEALLFGAYTFRIVRSSMYVDCIIFR